MQTCPFCGGEMRRGTIRLRGWYAQAVTAIFEAEDRAEDGAREKTQVLGPSFLRRGRRGASCCVRCDAVVVDPKPPEPEPGPAFPRYGTTQTETS
jgi:hypothetical protein